MEASSKSLCHRHAYASVAWERIDDGPAVKCRLSKQGGPNGPPLNRQFFWSLGMMETVGREPWTLPEGNPPEVYHELDGSRRLPQDPS